MIHLVVLLLLGCMSPSRSPDLPRSQPATIQIGLSCPDLSPVDLEESAVHPVERALSEDPRIQKITSTIQSGEAQIQVELVDGADPLVVQQSVRKMLAEGSALPDCVPSGVMTRID